MTNTKKYHHGNLKAALFEAGLEILAESGLSGLSLRNCADRAGVSHTAPKNHFGNITGLLTALAACGYEMLFGFMQRDLSADAKRAERRNAALIGYVKFAADHPALFELMFSKRKINGDDPVLKAPIGACLTILQDISKGLVWDKSDLQDADQRAQTVLWSMVHGYAQLVASGTLKAETMNGLDVLDVLPQFHDSGPDQTQ